MKKLISVIIAAALILSLCGCSLKTEDDGLTVGVIDELKSFSPAKAAGDAELLTVINCYEGLMRFNADGSVSPSGAVAYSVTSDGLCYTFRLNPSAVWHISDEAREVLSDAGIKPADFDNRVTARDYVESLLGAIREKAPGYERLLCIKGAREYLCGECTEDDVGLECESDSALNITLEKPYGDILTALALPASLPECAAFKAVAGENYAKTLSCSVFNGPYYVGSISQTGTVELCKNPDYNGIANTLNSGITLYLTGKRDMLATRFETGIYDIFKAGITVSDDENKTILSYGTEIWGMAFNCSSEYFADSNLRLALACDTDFEMFKKPAFAVREASELIPQKYTLGDKLFAEFAQGIQKQFDLQQAVLYFIKSNAMKYAPLKLKIAVPFEYENTFNIICAQWEADFPGVIETELTLFDKNDAETIRDGGNYDIAVLPLKPDYTTAVSVLESIKKPPCNYSAAGFDTLIEKTSEARADELAPVLYEAQNHIVNTAVFIPLFETEKSIIVADGIDGIYTSENGELIYFNGAAKAAV